MKSVNIVFLNQTRYFSFKQLPNCPHEAGWTPFQRQSTFIIVEVPGIKTVTSVIISLLLPLLLHCISRLIICVSGVKHQNIICDGCKKHGISGMRWKCARCYDYDLCTSCYMSDKHDLAHLFQRFETASSIGLVDSYYVFQVFCY